MNAHHCTSSPNLALRQWRGENHWDKSNIILQDLESSDPKSVPQVIAHDTQVSIIELSANKIRQCSHCKKILTEAFSIPQTWWSDHNRNSNGYFGCKHTRHEGFITGFNTWAYFEVKQLKPNKKYQWYKINILTRWLSSTNQTMILLFDLKEPMTEKVPGFFETPDAELLVNPFWVYLPLLEGVVGLEDRSVWAIRDHVRDIEKSKTGPVSPGHPETEYRLIHDIARHAIHVTETLDVLAGNLDHTLRQHTNYTATRANDARSAADEDTHARLEVLHSYITSMRHRSLANEKRLQNEIQLAFNNVAQSNAAISVQIGDAALSDSTAMKTVAYVTLAFLPPTFISSIFSMSFFHYDDGSGWNVSGKIWIYFVVAVPLAVVTVYLWNYWHQTVVDPQRRGQLRTRTQVVKEVV